VTEGSLPSADEKPLLTIAVPTFNRESCLRELLGILFDQLVSEPRVELIVSDNASPDETPLVIQEFQQRGLRIRYIRNETNIGADRNLLQCYELAQGKYVWVFGDDDVILPGGVAVVLSYVESKDYEIVYLNSYIFKGEYTPLTLEPARNAVEMTDIEEYSRRINIFFTFISGNIVNKDVVQATNPAPFAELAGTCLVQLGWTFAALNGFQRGLFIDQRLIAARTDNTGAYKLLETFGPNLKRVTEQRLNKHSLRRIVLNGALLRFWPGILLYYKKSAHNFINEDRPAEILTPIFKDNLRYWIFVYPILRLPYFLAAIYIRFIGALNRVDKACGSVLLN
jgi:abequosyltransferase